MEESLRPGCRRDFGDLMVGHFGQASQHVFETGIGINAATPAAFDNGIKDGTPWREPAMETGWSNGL